MQNIKTLRYLFFSLRPKHWIKNLFIFLPLIFGKKLFSFPENVETAFAFFIFSLAASCAYLINDVWDYKKDKIHYAKRLRPIASGKITLKTAMIFALIIFFLSVSFAFMLNTSFGLIILIYLAFNGLYSKFLKEIMIIDVFCIGFFFLLRVIAGGVVASVELSSWVILITFLLALFLGFNKRRQELIFLGRKAVTHRFVLTKYSSYFIDQMVGVLTSSIVVVYMLYTMDAKTISFFGTRNLIWSIPFVYYGIFRYLYLIHKIRRDGEPTRILLSDKPMQLNLLLWIIVCVGIIYFKV